MEEKKGLIAELNRIQEERGFLSEVDLRALSERLRVPLYRLQGLASFYPHFRTSPPPGASIALCRDMSCHLAGARDLSARVGEELSPEITSGLVEVQRVSCLGRCDAAPAGCVNSAPLPASRPEDVDLNERARLIAAWARRPGGIPRDEPGTAPRRWKSDPYLEPAARYGVLRALLAESSLAAGPGGAPPQPDVGEFPDAVALRVIAQLKEAGLKGMGGAGFPAGTKWELVRRQTRRPKYIIVNADESEPGTFKDRVILEELPHLIIEGAILAGLVAGAERGIVYIRHEYGRERRALEREIARAQEMGLLSPPHAPRRSSFTLEIFVSPGGYILGEETALLEALEDRRGEPRNKPPFPVSDGLFGQPTVINNVETLAMVPAILARGADWWKAQGRDGFAGLKFIAVSGHVERPGVYEIATGTRIQDLIAEAGGVSGGRALAAIAPGGASSPFLPPSSADTPLDFKALQDAGSMLGSGAVVVVAAGTDLLDLATNVVTFFRNESCGKCVPCRTGTEKAVAILEDLLGGRGDRTAVGLLPVLGETLALTSICGLGQVALNPILSVMKNFPGLIASPPEAAGHGQS